MTSRTNPADHPGTPYRRRPVGHRFRCACIALALAGGFSLPAAGQSDERFGIQSFDIRGVSVVGLDELRRATTAAVGRDKTFADVQRAVEAIEGLYAAKGFSAVQVLLPEQDISNGTVVIQVIETPVGAVRIAGNAALSAASIRRALPSVQEGKAPNTRQISENVQLANENGARQLNVVLGVGAVENTVDARIEVTEDKVSRFFATADNTGSEPTGEYRIGLGYVHHNLFDRDHSGSVAYTTSPDAPSGVDVHVVSASYRIPFYGIGDSLGILLGYSNVDTPTAQTSTGFAINGQGAVAALRWNHYLGRRGQYSSQVSGGLDYKAVINRCKSTVGPIPQTAACIDYTTFPLTILYTGKREGIGQQFEYSLGLSQNIPTGDDVPYPNDTAPLGSDKYTFVAGGRKVKDSFSIVRFAGNYVNSFSDWLARGAITGQYAVDTALVSSEQMGLAGSQAVRGFLDRVVVADSGAVINLEAYTPDLAALMRLPGHNLRGLLFADYGKGRDNNLDDVNPGADPDKELASWGVGLRYNWGRDLSFRLDAASIVRAKPKDVFRGANPAGGFLDDNEKGDWRAHASLLLSF